MRALRLLCLLMLAVAPLGAQRGRGGGGGFGGAFRTEPVVEPLTYDGRFTIVRLKFTTNSPVGYYYRGLPAWAHGYPASERNLVRILN